MVWSEGDMSLKNPVTPPGIDPGTVRLVAQRLNHYATPGPPSLEVQYLFLALVASSNLNRWHYIFLLTEHIPYQILREVIIRKGYFLFAAWKLQMINVLICFVYKVIFSPRLKLSL